MPPKRKNNFLIALVLRYGPVGLFAKKITTASTDPSSKPSGGK